MLAEGLDLEQNFSQGIADKVTNALREFQINPGLRGRYSYDNLSLIHI